MSAEHELEELRERHHTREEVLRLEGKVAAAYDYGTRTGERVAVLEREQEAVSEDVREVKKDVKDLLAKVGALTERGAWGRRLSVARDIAAMFGLGGMGLWAVLEILRRAP